MAVHARGESVVLMRSRLPRNPNLFVITIASEKGGVGKTTIATNLAVYLKALNEELPVTITSFDNHFTVDHMFAIGPQPPFNISDLLHNRTAREVTVLGQYGVQYIASENHLRTPPHPPSWLRERLNSAKIEGILILDTKPVLDWHTEAALLSSDLVIAPIKDRAALINVIKLQNVLQRVGGGQRLWLLPSLVDERAKFEDNGKVYKFLISAAIEQNFQVLDIHISKSPKVESLASASSLRIHPILTKARNTAVHGQMKQLGEFVCRQYQSHLDALGTYHAKPSPEVVNDLPIEHHHRLVRECPVCNKGSLSEKGYFFYDIRTQRKGLLHRDCLRWILGDLDLSQPWQQHSLMALAFDGPGIVHKEGCIALHFFEHSGKLAFSQRFLSKEHKSLLDVVVNICGCQPDTMFRELSLMKLKPLSINKQLGDPKNMHFRHLRKKALKQLLSAGHY